MWYTNHQIWLRWSGLRVSNKKIELNPKYFSKLDELVNYTPKNSSQVSRIFGVLSEDGLKLNSRADKESARKI